MSTSMLRGMVICIEQHLLVRICMWQHVLATVRAEFLVILLSHKCDSFSTIDT